MLKGGHLVARKVGRCVETRHAIGGLIGPPGRTTVRSGFNADGDVEYGVKGSI